MNPWNVEFIQAKVDDRPNCGRGFSRRIGVIVLAILVIVGCTAGEREERDITAVAERGQALYNENCRSCHGGATGGQMMDIPPPHNANGHTWHHPDCQLKEIVLNGSGEMGEMMREMMGAEDSPQMPAFGGQLSEEEVEAILAYVKTWWTADQREMQAQITEVRC